MIQLENLCRHFEVGNQLVRALDEVTLGINKKEYLAKQHYNNLPLMRLIKKSIDPNNIMNPGKIIDLN